MIRRPPRSTRVRSSAASDVYKRQIPTRRRILRSRSTEEDASRASCDVSRTRPPSSGSCAGRSGGPSGSGPSKAPRVSVIFSQQLVAREETVLDVPATLVARARLLAPGHGRKTDGIDAASVATVAQNQPDLRRVGPEDHSAVLRLLSDRRDELSGEL